MKTVIGLTVNNEVRERFILYCKFCNDELECKNDLVLDKFEVHKKDKNIFRLTFIGFGNVIFFFYGLGRVLEIDITDSLHFHKN